MTDDWPFFDQLQRSVPLVFQAVPSLFASAIFASSFAGTDGASSALASNLLGATDLRLRPPGPLRPGVGLRAPEHGVGRNGGERFLAPLRRAGKGRQRLRATDVGEMTCAETADCRGSR